MCRPASEICEKVLEDLSIHLSLLQIKDLTYASMTPDPPQKASGLFCCQRSYGILLEVVAENQLELYRWS